MTEILLPITLPADAVRRFTPTAFEAQIWAGSHSAYSQLANAVERFFSLSSRPANRPQARCTSRAPHIHTVTKSAAKAASAGAGDPDPEPELSRYTLLPLLAIPAFWQLLRPDNPGQNNPTNAKTDHRRLCARTSPIAFGSAK